MDRHDPQWLAGEKPFEGFQGNVRRCVTMEEHRRLLRIDPDYRWRRRRIEEETLAWLRRHGDEGRRSGLIRIPVVVHVIYNTATENITDAQINSQIAVLNEDFRRLNADAASTPPAFAGVAADARLEFQLAARDPSCNPTNGITRTSTSVTGWTYPGNGMKATATGGRDPWDVERYLNIWVVNYTDGTLGFGTFPGMPAATQGVVIHYRAFGRTGTVDAPFHLGRTGTHEVGHFLNLLHIWGDDGGACSGDDQVADTPNQADLRVGCPTFPAVSCSNGPDGDMFMNYMDYVDDACYNLFTAGQAARMDAALHTSRMGLLGSHGLVPPSGGTVPDLWSKDVSDDTGAEPDPSTQPMYISDDIWVRTSADGLLNHDHQNPEYRPSAGPSNYVYVRVRNRGCSGSQSGTVRLYWAKASTGLSWPAPWDGSVTTPAPMGGMIGSQPVTVAAGDEEILVFPWWPPNPADYAAFGADQSHFCLLSRIETSSSPPYGMTSPETSNLYANVRNNNNIVWKNITVVDDVAGLGRFATALVANFEDEIQQARLTFRTPKGERVTVFDFGDVVVELPEEAWSRWRESECETAGLEEMQEGRFRIVRSGATIGPIELAPGEVLPVHIRFLPDAKEPLGARVLALDVVQRTKEGIVGGQRFVLKTTPDRTVQEGRPPQHFDGVEWTPTGADDCCRCC